VHGNSITVCFTARCGNETHLNIKGFLNQGFIYSPIDAPVNCLKNNFKIYIKINIKTAPTCFGAITVIRERITRAC
jgi:hypothetical protein